MVPLWRLLWRLCGISALRLLWRLCGVSCGASALRLLWRLRTAPSVASPVAPLHCAFCGAPALRLVWRLRTVPYLDLDITPRDHSISDLALIRCSTQNMLKPNDLLCFI